LYWVLLGCIFLLICVLTYIAYKIVWYTIIMIRLKLHLNKWNAQLIRPFHRIIFGNKGQFNFMIRTSKTQLSVAVVSYMSKHSRLNIEKHGEEYYINVRRKSFVFKEFYHHSEEPKHSIQYHSEMSLCYKALLLEKPKIGTTPILLFYPSPKELTCADREMKILYSGDKIGKHEVMFWHDLCSLMK